MIKLLVLIEIVFTILSAPLEAFSKDYTEEAMAFANKQKPPYKEILIENIDKQFTNINSDGGKEITEKEYKTLLRFILSMSQYYGANSEDKTDPQEAETEITKSEQKSQTNGISTDSVNSKSDASNIFSNLKAQSSNFFNTIKEKYFNSSKKDEHNKTILKNDSSTQETKLSASHAEIVNKLKKKISKDHEQSALLCKELADYYSLHAVEHRTTSFEGYTPDITVKEIVHTNLPSPDETWGDELELIYNCNFVRGHIELKTIANGSVFNMGKYFCTNCGFFWQSALYLQMTQKLSQNLYNAQAVLMTNGMHLRNSFSTGKSYLLRTDEGYSNSGNYVWGVFAGEQSVEMLNGFSKNAPVIIDVGSKGVSSINARLGEIARFLYSNDKYENLVRCGFVTGGLSKVSIINIGCFNKSKSGVTEFTEYKPKISKDKKKEALNFLTALVNKDLKTAKKIMKNIDPNLSYDSVPVIHMASLNGDVEIVKYLIEKGANIDAFDKNNCTPLIVASYEGKKEIVQYLISKGSNVNHIDNQKTTALSSATANKHQDIVKILIAAGAKK